MRLSTAKLQRGAQRAQFRVLSPPSGATDTKKKKSNRKGRQVTMPRQADKRGKPLSLAQAYEESSYILLYRELFNDVAALIDRANGMDRTDFHHAMRTMQMMGLGSDEVANSLQYAQAHVCRWMSGERCPHQNIRQFIVKRCVELLRPRVENNPPKAFASRGSHV